MKTCAIVPVNVLGEAKSRLKGCLSREQRKGLMQAMLEDVLTALRAVPTIVISPEDLRELLQPWNVAFLLQQGVVELDPGVRQANKYAMELGADATLFVPADMPLITPGDVAEVLRLGEEHNVIITQSRDGGTGILYRRPPDVMESRFTQNSFEDHLAEAKRRGIEPYILNALRLSMDLDTEEDLKMFMKLGKGTATYEHLKKCGY